MDPERAMANEDQLGELLAAAIRERDEARRIASERRALLDEHGRCDVDEGWVNSRVCAHCGGKKHKPDCAWQAAVKPASWEAP